MDAAALTANRTITVPDSDIDLGKMAIWARGADVASASALPILSSFNYFDITGTTSITSINSVGVDSVIKLHFDTVLTLTHHATNLILLSSANIITAAGDEAEFVEYATGQYRMTNYSRADGSALFAEAGGASTGNLLVNAGFWFNDTGYVSNVVLSNSDYSHDNYKAGSGGCTYTFTQNGNFPIQINITAGSIVTAIEDFNFADYSDDVTVSWDGTAQARVKNGLTTDLTSESYVASPIVISKTANTGLSIEFGLGTAGKIVVVKSSSAGEWGQYDIGQERLRSQRYNQMFYMPYFRESASAQYQILVIPIFFNEMRVVPSLYHISHSQANMNNITVSMPENSCGYFLMEAAAAGAFFVLNYTALLTARLI